MRLMSNPSFGSQMTQVSGCQRNTITLFVPRSLPAYIMEKAFLYPAVGLAIGLQYAG
ncbi:hypothetical protein BDV25DRAFT_162957 [Aspergillus avenaceus]|uniref:Uncharacterized protein n=1 Tax=Aspergillus avenaceus TaxID=36643 RepID=A0A5N6TIN4_ASPAV|nr:hypothetical protein BDV25DRAFT_162957 [Aspergillus avenaceus]